MFKMGLISWMAFLMCCFGCQSKNETVAKNDETRMSVNINVNGNHISDRFLPPNGYTLMNHTSGFSQFLSNIELMPDGNKVLLYDGSLKRNQHAHAAILNIPVGNKDLQQCADAIMRLRAEYLYQKEAYNPLKFNFTNGFTCDYMHWKDGYRVQINGNHCSWQKTAEPSTSRESFEKYLELVFSYAGTLSLEKELLPTTIKDIQPGDVFIHGGSPGHAVIVVQVAQDSITHEKIFMLAQSYMPAQQIHILKNPNNTDVSPWYQMPKGDILETPEWTFEITELKKFADLDR